MNPPEAYLAELRDIRASGAAVPETSGYGALANLLNEVGGKLKPKVRCLINLQNAGAGIPDGGLFTASQFQKGAHATEPLAGQMPGPRRPRGQAGWRTTSAPSPRASRCCRYLEKYRQVLVTNYREFVLVGLDARRRGGAASRATAWPPPSRSSGRSPRIPGSDAARQVGERLTDFLQARAAAPGADRRAQGPRLVPRQLRPRGPRPRRGARPAALGEHRKALEEALGMSFTGEKGEHFFHSTLVQTLFYGLFAAWVLWAEQHPPDRRAGTLRLAQGRQLPARPDPAEALPRLQPTRRSSTLMRIDEVLDWAADALNRVDRAAFFATFEQSHAVQYFYEPFLEAFDPELRKELGVWYTPPEIVQYMVARVDTVLREELDIADGLADPRVLVLDPCCGTGAYLVEVLNKIAATLAREERRRRRSGGPRAQAGRHERVFGFEILPAPFVVSHLQLGLLLHRPRRAASRTSPTSAPASTSPTPSPAGSRPPSPSSTCSSPRWRRSATGRRRVKQHAPILVILGQPAVQRLRRHGDGRGARPRRRPTATTKKVAAAAGPGPERPVRPLLPHGRAAHHREAPRARASSATSPTTRGSTASRTPACASGTSRPSTRSGSTA